MQYINKKPKTLVETKSMVWFPKTKTKSILDEFPTNLGEGVIVCEDASACPKTGFGFCSAEGRWFEQEKKAFQSTVNRRNCLKFSIAFILGFISHSSLDIHI